MHDVVFGHHGVRLATVRDSRWKLHVPLARDLPSDGCQVNPRAPDGVTILVPYQQAQPWECPRQREGDATGATSLFDLRDDRGERRNVSAEHQDIVARLTAYCDRIMGKLPTGSTEATSAQSASV